MLNNKREIKNKSYEAYKNSVGLRKMTTTKKSFRKNQEIIKNQNKEYEKYIFFKNLYNTMSSLEEE